MVGLVFCLLHAFVKQGSVVFCKRQRRKTLENEALGGKRAKIKQKVEETQEVLRRRSIVLDPRSARVITCQLARCDLELHLVGQVQPLPLKNFTGRSQKKQQQSSPCEQARTRSDHISEFAASLVHTLAKDNPPSRRSFMGSW